MVKDLSLERKRWETRIVLLYSATSWMKRVKVGHDKAALSACMKTTDA